MLEADEGVATTSALAARLDVSAASASWMVKKGIPVFEVREESGWIAVRPRKPSEQDDDGA